MNLFYTLLHLEEDDNIHLGRLLILLATFAEKDGTGTIGGLTKLAKLDFLLRYPVYLERALQAKNASAKDMNIAEYERKSVESSMVRYRYGPWDFRYRRFINLLVAKGLAKVEIKGKTIDAGLTPKGVNTAKTLAQDERFHDIVGRAKILKRYFNLSGTNLMKFIYKTFPEIVTLRLGEEIHL
jgi:hypothetical protein